MLSIREVIGDQRSDGGNITQIEGNLSTIILARKDGTVQRCCRSTLTSEETNTYQQPDFDTVIIPIRTGFDDIRHVFLDSTGIHSLVCLSNGDMYYMHSESIRPWKLARLRGAAESAVLVGYRNDRTGNTNRHTTERSTTVTTNTVSLLVGTSVGFLYEVLLTIEETISIAATRVVTIVVREQSAVVLYQLEDQTAITSLRLETLRCTNENDVKKRTEDIRFLLLFATYASARLYHFLWASIRTQPSPGGLPSAQVELPSQQTLKLHAEACNQSSNNLPPLILSVKLYTRLALLSADILELPGESSWGTRVYSLPALLFLSPPVSAVVGHGDTQTVTAGSRTGTRIPGTNNISTVNDAKSVMPAAVFALLTPMGIYHGSLSLSMQNNGAGADVTVSLDSAHLFPYALPSRSMTSIATALTSNNSSSVGAGAGSGGSGGVSAESDGVGLDDDGDDDQDDAMDDALIRTPVTSSLLIPHSTATVGTGAEMTTTSALAMATSNVNGSKCTPVGLAVTAHHFLVLAEVSDNGFKPAGSGSALVDHDPHSIMCLLFMSRLDGHLVHCIHLMTEEGDTTPVITPQSSANPFTANASTPSPPYPSSSMHRNVLDKDKGGHGRSTSSVVHVRGRPLGLSALTSAATATSTSGVTGKGGVTTCCWLYTDRSVLEVRVEDEESFVWRTYLNKALVVKTNRLRIANALGKLSRITDSDNIDAVREATDDALSPAALANTLASFRSALQFCKYNSERSLVLRSEAEFLLSLAHSSPQGDEINNSSGCERYEQAAAVCFAQSNVAFDEVVLRLLRMIPAVTTVASAQRMSQVEHSDDEDGDSTLRDVKFAKDWQWLGNESLYEGQSTSDWRWQAVHQYLNELVSDHDSSTAAAAVSDSPTTGLIKRTMICTWICELALQRVTHLEQKVQLANNSSSSNQSVSSGGKSTDQQTVLTQALAGTVGEIKDFLRKQRSSLDISTTAALLRAHCSSRSSSRSLPLFYSQIVGDFDNLTALYISEGNHRAAVAVLGDAAASPTVGLRRVEGLIYKHGPQLFEFAPEAFVSLLLRIGVGTSRLAPQSCSNHKQHKTGLSLTGLLPAVLRYTTLLDRQSMQRQQKKQQSTIPSVAGTVPSRSLDINAEGQRVNFAIFLLLEVYKRFGTRSSTALPNDPLVLQTLTWLLIKYHGEGYDCEDHGGSHSHSHSHDTEAVLVRILWPLCEQLLALKNECFENFLAADLEAQAMGGTGNLSHELADSLDGDNPLADELLLISSDSSRVIPSALSLDRDFADIHAVATNDIVQTGTPQRHTFSVNRAASDTVTNNDGGGSVYIRTAGLGRGDSMTTPLPLLGYDAFALHSARAHRAALVRLLPGVDLDMLLRECLRKRESMRKSSDDVTMTISSKKSLCPCPLGKTIALLHVLCGRDEEAITAALDCDQQNTQTPTTINISTHASGPSTPRSDAITHHHPTASLDYAKNVCRMLCGQSAKPSSSSSTTTTSQQQHPSLPNLDAASPFDSTRMTAATNFSSSLVPVLNVDRQRYRHDLWMIVAEHAMIHARVTSRILSASPKRSDRQHAVRDAAQTALELLADSDGDLQMEDLLPLMPDFTEFGLVRDELCRSLERSSLRVEEATASMAELADSAEAIVRELDETKNRGYTLSSVQRCELCEAPLFNTSHHFYVFPCSHGMHSECLLHLAPELLSSGRQDDYHTHYRHHQKGGGLEHVHSIVEQMRLLAPRAQHDNDKRAQTQMELLQAELDAYIAADCPLCGYVMIRSIGQPLISDSATDIEEAKSWIL